MNPYIYMAIYFLEILYVFFLVIAQPYYDLGELNAWGSRGSASLQEV